MQVKLSKNAQFGLAAIVGISMLTACYKAESSSKPAQIDAKALRDRFITPYKGVAAIVFNEKGEAVAVTADGKTAEPCILPGSDDTKGDDKAGDSRSTDKTSTERSATSSRVPLCHAARNTSVKWIHPVTIMRNTGSQCMTFFYNAGGGELKAFQYCW